MIRKKVLCEVAFWRSFSECYPSLMPFPDEEAIENLKSWMELYSFMFRSNLYFDCKASQFYSLCEVDERLRYLWKKSTELDCGVNFSEGTIDNDVLRSNPQSVLLSANDRLDETKRFGIMNITAENYQVKGFLFRENGFPLQNNQEWEWSNLSKLVSKEMANSLLIIDNYILSTDGQFKRTNIEDNIFKILNVLLPDSCNVPFDLTVFYVDGNKSNEERLQQYVNDIRPNLEVNFNIYQLARNDFHDRTIVSNNYWISSPGGFDLLKKKRDNKYYVTKNTTVTVWFPFFCSRNIIISDQSYENLIHGAKHALRIRELRSNNRLLEEQEVNTSNTKSGRKNSTVPTLSFIMSA